MVLFVLFALLVYSFMHALFYARVSVLLPAHSWVRWGALVFLALMTLSPFAGHIFALAGKNGAARIVDSIAYPWMGFLFLSLCGGLAIRLYNMAARAGMRFLHLDLPLLEGPAPVAVMLGIVLAMCAWGWVENQRLTVEYLTIPTPKLPQGCGSLSLVQISDVHLGFMHSPERLAEIAATVERLQPDILVCTGDLVDSHSLDLDEFRPILENMQARHGKFAVTGNHEAYFDSEGAIRFIEECGFSVLRGRMASPGGCIHLAGVDDSFLQPGVTELQVLQESPGGLFTVLLKHQADVDKKAAALFDLQLSGHAHGGQIFPFHLLAKLRFPYFSGLYSLGNGSRIYISRGSGSWGPPLRIGSRREVTLINIVKSGAEEF